MRAFYRAYKDLHARIVERANWLTVPLRPGMALVFDNWRLLHGRLGYVGKRVFCGCYHNHEDFESALRTLSRSEEHTSELQSLMRSSYAVFCLKKKNY